MTTDMMWIVIVGALLLLVPVVMVAAQSAISGPGAWSLAHFSSYLAAVVRQNLPLGQAIETCAQDGPKGNPFKRAMLRTIAEQVDNGRPLSEVMAAYPGAFPAPYRALVRAGERGGSLARVLEHLREAAEVADAGGRRAMIHITYPLMVSLVVCVVAVFSLIFVAPMLGQVFGEMEVEFDGNPAARMVVAGHLAPVVPVVLLFVALLCSSWTALRGFLERFVPSLSRLLSWLTWRTPVFSRYERRRATAGYALAAGRLLEAGVPVEEALEIAAGAAGSHYFERIAGGAAGLVAEGQPLSAALRAGDRRGELPADFLWYLEVGEASGQLPESLSRAAHSALARTRSALSGLVSLVFPLAIIAVALVVGTMAYSLFDTMAFVMENLPA